MRVLLVTKPLASPWDDSAKLIPRALVTRAAEAVRFDVLSARGDATAWPAGVTPRSVAPAGGYDTAWRTRWDLVRSVLRWGPRVDLLHFFFQPHPLASGLARWLTRWVRRPSVHTVLSAPLRGTESGLLFADRTVTLSRHTADRFVAAGERAPSVIPPALPDETPVGPARAQAARRDAGLDGAFVLYPGDYEFSGGQALLLRVWQRHAGLPRLVLSGRDKTAAAAARRRELALQASRLGLADRVRFLGRVPDLGGLQAAAEALLFPAESLYAKSDLPLVVLEAWRDGVPVLVSDLAPLREAIGDGGAVLAPDEDAWLGALRELPERRRALAGAGAARWRTWYSAERAASSYLAVYRSLCDDSIPRAQRGESLEP